MDKGERERALKKKAAERERLQSRIRELDEKRREYLAEKTAAAPAPSLGAAVLDAVQAQRRR